MARLPYIGWLCNRFFVLALLTDEEFADSGRGTDTTNDATDKTTYGCADTRTNA